MATFLRKWMHPAGGFGQKAWDAARAAGYSEKQIAVASHKEQAAGAIIWPKFDAHRKAGAAAARGTPGNWIHNYTGGSGGVGTAGLSMGLSSGRTLNEMMDAASGLHMNQSWGVPGFGNLASQYALSHQPPILPPEPEFEMPGTHMGGGRVLGTSALGVRSALGSQDNTGGTQDAFGRKQGEAATKKKKATNAYAAQLRVNPLG